MKKTKFEFYIHKFDYVMPVYSDNKNLVSEQREQVISCLEQLKIKMLDVVSNLSVTSGGIISADYDRCIHLVSYYNNALKVIRDKELSEVALSSRDRASETELQERFYSNSNKRD